jgi:hypothetical protein
MNRSDQWRDNDPDKETAEIQKKNQSFGFGDFFILTKMINVFLFQKK